MAHHVVSRAPRREEDLEPIAPNDSAGIAVRAAELRYQNGRAERPFVSRPRGRVDVPTLVGTRRIILPGEVEGRDARRLVLEVRRASVLKGRVDDAAEVLRGLPALRAGVEAVVVPVGDKEVRVAAAPASGTVEVHLVPIRGEGRGQIHPGRIDVGPQVLRGTPRSTDAVSVRDPDVEHAEPSWAVGADVQAQAILRDRRVIVVVWGIDDRAEVRRRAPRAV